MAKMNDATKKIAVILAVASSAFLQTTRGDDVRVCRTPEACVELSSVEYNQLKASLADKVAADEPIEWDEFKLYIAMLNHEMKGGRNIGSVQNSSDLKRMLNKELYAK